MRFPQATLFLVMAPLLAFAAGKESETEPARAIPLEESVLQNTVHASDMLDKRVRTSDGRQIGRLLDVVVMQNGKVKEYLIEPSVPEDTSMQSDAVEFRDDVADYGEPPLYEPASQDEELLAPYLTLPPHNVTYDSEQRIVQINLEDRALGDLPRKDRDISRPETGVYVRDLIGLEVELTDAKPFGEVKEVLLSKDGRKVAAYVVESFDEPHDSPHLALPAYDAQFIRADRDRPVRQEFGVESIAFPFAREYLEAMPRYNTSAHAPVKHIGN